VEAEKNPELVNLSNSVVGNVGMVFTNENIREICHKITGNTKVVAARVGVFAPNKVIVPKGPTGLGPENTSFFQVLNIPTRIVKSNIEISSDVDLIEKGQKVTSSEVALLSKLNIKPFLFSPGITSVYDNGVSFSPEIIEMSREKVAQLVSQTASIVAAIGLSTGLPNTASVAHSLRHAMKIEIAVSIESGYIIKEAAEIKDAIDNPDKYSSAAAAPVEKKEEKIEEEKEEESEGPGDMGGLFDSDSDSE